MDIYKHLHKVGWHSGLVYKQHIYLIKLEHVTVEDQLMYWFLRKTCSLRLNVK